jgi:hypothetical protein
LNEVKTKAAAPKHSEGGPKSNFATSYGSASQPSAAESEGCRAGSSRRSEAKAGFGKPLHFVISDFTFWL